MHNGYTKRHKLAADCSPEDSLHSQVFSAYWGTVHPSMWTSGSMMSAHDLSAFEEHEDLGLSSHPTDFYTVLWLMDTYTVLWMMDSYRCVKRESTSCKCPQSPGTRRSYIDNTTHHSYIDNTTRHSYIDNTTRHRYIDNTTRRRYREAKGSAVDTNYTSHVTIERQVWCVSGAEDVSKG